MGGMQALAMGLRHPDRFAWIRVFSPVTEPEIPQRYSAQLAQANTLNSALSLLWVGCGTLDNLFQRTKSVDEALTAHGIRREFHLRKARDIDATTWPSSRRERFATLSLDKVRSIRTRG